jgi:hypothetical protein
LYLKIIENPLEPYNGTVKQVTPIPGEPVFNYVKAQIMIPEEELGIILNGQIITIEESKQIIPDVDDFIIIIPHVGGGDGNQILAAVLMIVVSAYLGPMAGQWGSAATGATAATTAATTWNMWGWAASIGVQIAGGYLINQWFGKTPKEDKSSPTYGFNGVQPLFGNNQPQPVTFGKVKTAGQIVSSYVDYSGSKQYMNILIEAGEGPCDYIGNGENSNCTGISNIKINGNSISNYSGVTIYKRAGLNNQSIIPNFDDIITQKSLNYCLNTDGPGNWFTDTASVAGDGLRVVFYWPTGLRQNDKDGDRDPLLERFQVQYKLTSSSEWTTWNEFEIERNTGTAFWQTYRLDNLTTGTYNVRCKCTFVGYKTLQTTTDSNGNQTTAMVYVNDFSKSRDQYLLYWSSLDSVVYDNFQRPNKILLGLKALATDQLNGNFTVTFELSRSNVWVWNPDDEEYQLKPANNPAWAAYWTLHRVYHLQDIHTNEWQYVVRGVPAERILYQEFSNWADFCTERGLEINIIFDIKQKVEDALKIISEMGRGSILNRASHYGCVFDAPAEKDLDGNIIPDQVFNMSNIILDSFSEQFVDKSERSTAIEVTYRDRDNDYESTTRLVPADGLDESESLENITQITWNGCTSWAQAWKEAKYRLRLNHYLVNTGAWQADVNAIVSSLGQVVMLSHDVPAWGISGRVVDATLNTITLDQSILTDIQGDPFYDPEKTYQILITYLDDSTVYKTVDSVDETGTIITLTTNFEVIPESGDMFNFGELQKHSKPFKLASIQRSGEMQYTLSGMEYIDELYTEATDVPEIEYSYLDPIFDVTVLTVKEETFKQKDGTMISRLNCSWVVPLGKIADSFLVYFSTDNGLTWEYYETTIADKTFIDNVKTGTTYLVKIIVRKDILNSTGVVSNAVTVSGKDIPPSDVQKLTISQDNGILIATITLVDDPDVEKYELRLGPSLANSYKIINDFAGPISEQFQAPANGSLTFWCRAIDRSNNYSENAAKCTIDVYNAPPKNYIFQRQEDLSTWTVQGMYRDLDGNWRRQTKERCGDYTFFYELFSLPSWSYETNAQAVFPVAELDSDILEADCYYFDLEGNQHLQTVQKCGDYTYFYELFNLSQLDLVQPAPAIKTYLGIKPTYNNGINNRIDSEYKISADGSMWSEWINSNASLFVGRYVEAKLLPVTLDNYTDVVISSATLEVDAPDVNDQLTNIDIPVGGVRVSWRQKFYDTPIMESIYARDLTGLSVMPQVTNETKDGFDVLIPNGTGGSVAGKIISVTGKGY